MVLRNLRCWMIVAAGLTLAGTAIAADDDKKPPVPSKGFYAQFLNPQMSRRLTGEAAAATEFVDPKANPWTKDNHTVLRIERGAFGAATNALKNYAIHELKLDSWSLPLGAGHGLGPSAQHEDYRSTRLRFGISHLTPRADVLVQSARGRVVFSFDAKGRVGTSFESQASSFSLGLSYDAPTNSGSFSLSKRF